MYLNMFESINMIYTRHRHSPNTSCNTDWKIGVLYLGEEYIELFYTVYDWFGSWFICWDRLGCAVKYITLFCLGISITGWLCLMLERRHPDISIIYWLNTKTCVLNDVRNTSVRVRILQVNVMRQALTEISSDRELFCKPDKL